MREEFLAIQKQSTGLQLFLLHHFMMLYTKHTHVCLMPGYEVKRIPLDNNSSISYNALAKCGYPATLYMPLSINFMIGTTMHFPLTQTTSSIYNSRNDKREGLHPQVVVW